MVQLQWVSSKWVSSGNALAPNSRQAITWTKYDLIYVYVDNFKCRLADKKDIALGIAMPADALAPNGARPSAEGVVTNNIRISLSDYWWFRKFFVDRVVLFKMTDQFPRDLIALRELISKRLYAFVQRVIVVAIKCNCVRSMMRLLCRANGMHRHTGLFMFWVVLKWNKFVYIAYYSLVAMRHSLQICSRWSQELTYSIQWIPWRWWPSIAKIQGHIRCETVPAQPTSYTQVLRRSD